MMSKYYLEGPYARQFLLRQESRSSTNARSQRNLAIEGGRELPPVPPRAPHTATTSTNGLPRQPSVPLRSEVSLNNRGESVSSLNSELLHKIEEGFDDYMTGNKSLKRVDSSPELIPRFFVPNTAQQRRITETRSSQNQNQDRRLQSSYSSINNNRAKANKPTTITPSSSKSSKSFSYQNSKFKSTPSPPPPQSTKSTPFPPRDSRKNKNAPIGKKSSRKVSWSQCETSGDKKSKQGQKRVFQKIEIEEVVVEKNGKVVAAGSRSFDSDRQKRFSKKGSIEDSPPAPEDQNFNVSESEPFSDLPEEEIKDDENEEEFNKINFDTFLEECDGMFSELHEIVKQREDIHEKIDSGETSSDAIDVLVEPTVRMKEIIRIVARKYVVTVEREWSRRRELWLDGKLSNSEKPEEDWGLGFESKTFQESIKKYEIPLQFPFDLRTVEIRQRNPLLTDKVKGEDSVESTTPSEISNFVRQMTPNPLENDVIAAPQEVPNFVEENKKWKAYDINSNECQGWWEPVS